MPIHEYRCGNNHVTEKLFLSFAEAEKTPVVTCPECHGKAKRIVSIPGVAILYGDGFYKPAASGKQSTRGADPSKVAKEVAHEMGGAKIAQAVKGSK